MPKGTKMNTVKKTPLLAAEVRFGVRINALPQVRRDGNCMAKLRSAGMINSPPLAHRLRWMISDPKSDGVAL